MFVKNIVGMIVLVYFFAVFVDMFVDEIYADKKFFIIKNFGCCSDFFNCVFF